MNPHTHKDKMKNVLFICVENACRSQMAEAFGRILGNGIVEVYSGGSNPSGKVNEKAIASMKAVGYDLSSHRSKSLDENPKIEYDLVVTMGCGDECSFVPAKQREDWDIPDPKHMDRDRFNKIRDLIKEKVSELIENIKTSNIHGVIN